MERGSTVLVIESRGTRQVVVMAWSDPSLDDERTDGSGDTGDAR
jgi:hypothetical protein